jgi:hypothetical protein
MEQKPASPMASRPPRIVYVLGVLALVFFALAAVFVGNLWGHAPARLQIALVDPAFLETTPWRQTYVDLVRAKEDLSDFDCYGCHDRKKPQVLRYDANNILIIPDEHKNIVMFHGSHNRNNQCYNCHSETNLETLHIRDGQELKFSESPQLCGSCHGPTYRDWEAGAHGRTSGYWDRSRGEIQRLLCANCHNPHNPRIPTRVPAPGPHALRTPVVAETHSATTP